MSRLLASLAAISLAVAVPSPLWRRLMQNHTPTQR